MEERFSYKAVEFKRVYLTLTTIFPPGTPVSGKRTLITGIVCAVDLVASAIHCQLMSWIDILDYHDLYFLINPQSTLDRHFMNSRSIVSRVSTDSYALI